MTDFASMTRLNWRADAVRHEHAVFRGLLARLERLRPKFEPPKPFDVGVALVSGQQQAERIALLGPQPLAVLRIGEQRVVERLFDRNAARHRRCVGAFGQHPFRLRLDARFREHGRQGNSGPFAATEQAVGVLRRQFGLWRAPVLGVAGTFEEVNPRHGWKSRHVLHGEDERPLDQSMHHQPVLGRIDRRNPAMVALIMQAVRGDDSVQVLKRRQAERRQAASAARASPGDNGARHWLRTWTAAHKAGSASPRRVGAAIPGPRAAGCRPLAPSAGRETIAAAAAPALAPNKLRRVKRRASPSRGSGAVGDGSVDSGVRGLICVLLAAQAPDWRTMRAIVAQIVWSDKSVDAGSLSSVARYEASALMLSSFGE